MSLPANIDDYQLNLFASIDEMREKMLPEHVVKRLLRLRALYTFWLNYPQKTSREILKHDLDMNADIKQREAYDDVRLLKILIGNIEKESKEWHRHVFNQRTEEVYKKAMAAQDFRSAEKANADYAKYNRVGEIDAVPVDYSEIKPLIIEPTDDPSVVGIKPVKGLRDKIAKLKKRFGADLEYTDFVEVKEDINIFEDGDTGQEENLSQ